MYGRTKTSLLAIFLGFVGLGVIAQVPKPPSSFFPAQRAKVLVVGTFHFDDPGLDAHQVAEENKVDVLSATRQKEMRELVDYIKRFQPTKIAIEAVDQWRATPKLRDYKAGKLELRRDERHQIALRLAAELGLDTLYSIDAANLATEMEARFPTYIDSLFRDFDFEHPDPALAAVKAWYDYEDSIGARMPLLAYFKWMNSPQYHRYDYGAYLVGDFKLDGQRGADILSIWWYNRNLRIFRKIQDLATSPNDRIMVLMGNGHAAVLRQLLECAPDLEFIEFGSL